VDPAPFSADWFLQWAPVIALPLSVLALLGTGVNTWIVLHRGKKRVRIRSSIRLEGTEGGAAEPLYACTITNDGFIGLQIDRVELRSHPDASAGVPLALPRGEDPRKLEQGEAQEWGVFMSDVWGSSSGDARLVAVAVDTTGRTFVQRRKDRLNLPSRSGGLGAP